MNKFIICTWAPSRNKLFCRKSSFLGEQKVKTAPDHLITWNRWSGEFFCKILAPYIQQYHLEFVLCIKVSFFWHLKNDFFPHSNWTMIWHLLLPTWQKIPKRETLGPVELVFKNKGRNYGHFERVKMEKRDKNWQKAFSKKVEVMTHRQKT